MGNSGNSQPHSDPERMHITLSTQNRERLDKLADQYHNGNTSACVRAAIESYRLSLNGDSVKAIEKLRNSVDKTHKELDKLRELVEDSVNSNANPQPARNPKQLATNPITSTDEIPEGLKTDIHQYLLNADDREATIFEICQAVDADSLIVEKTVRNLTKEVDFVDRVEDNGTKKFKIK